MLRQTILFTRSVCVCCGQNGFRLTARMVRGSKQYGANTHERAENSTEASFTLLWRDVGLSTGLNLVLFLLAFSVERTY